MQDSAQPPKRPRPEASESVDAALGAAWAVRSTVLPYVTCAEDLVSLALSFPAALATAALVAVGRLALEPQPYRDDLRTLARKLFPASTARSGRDLLRLLGNLRDSDDREAQSSDSDAPSRAGDAGVRKFRACDYLAVAAVVSRSAAVLRLIERSIRRISPRYAMPERLGAIALMLCCSRADAESVEVLSTSPAFGVGRAAAEALDCKALGRACRSGSARIVQLLARAPFGLSQPHAVRSRALTKACAGAGGAEMVALLAGEPWRLGHEQAVDGAVGAACASGRCDVVEALGRPPFSVGRGDTEAVAMALSEACRNGHHRVVELLVRTPFCASALGPAAFSVALLAACESGSVETLEMMARPPFHIDGPVVVDANMVDRAAGSKNGEMLRAFARPPFVVEHEGLDVEVSEMFFNACVWGNAGVVRAFADPPFSVVERRNAVVFSDNTNVLWKACKLGHKSVVQVLLSSPFSMYSQKSAASLAGITRCLRSACKGGNVCVLDTLAGCPLPYAVDGDLARRANALCLACLYGHKDVARALARPPFGLGHEDASADHCFALLCATIAGNRDVVQVLSGPPYSVGAVDLAPGWSAGLAPEFRQRLLDALVRAAKRANRCAGSITLCGGVDATVGVMREFFSDVEVLSVCCKLLCSVSAVVVSDEALSPRLIGGGVVEALVTAINGHVEDPRFNLGDAFAAIGNMCYIRDGVLRLMSIGGMESLMSAVGLCLDGRRPTDDLRDSLTSVAAFMGNYCAEDDLVSTANIRLATRCVVDILGVQRRHNRFDAIDILGKMARISADCAGIVARAGGVEAICKAARQFPAIEDCCYMASEALRGFTFYGPALVKEVVDAGAVELCGQWMEQHGESQEIHRSVLFLLLNICGDGTLEEAREQVVRANVHKSLVASMKAFPDNTELQENGCLAIGNLCETLSIIPVLEDAGALGVLTDAIARHMQEDSVVTFACYALCVLLSQVRGPDDAGNDTLLREHDRLACLTQTMLDEIEDPVTRKNVEHVIACLERRESADAVAARQAGRCSTQVARRCSLTCVSLKGDYCECSPAQMVARCATCVPPVWVCQVCAHKCHQGHELKYSFRPQFCACACSKPVF
eukprot:m51a1_g683 hypothetical protein (1106) ;mRNA; r:314881-318299